MIKTNEEALGIIFPNSYDSLVPELVTERSMASIPFAGRYRICDFLISSMVHSGIDNISLMVRKNYHSLMDHLGSGREWDLARKNGGLNIVPPYAQKSVKVYNGRIEALESIRGYLRKRSERYVIMADSNIAVNFDFRALLYNHIDSGADVTMVYYESEIPDALLNRVTDTSKDLYYTLDIGQENRIKKIYINPATEGVTNFSLNIYVLEREKLLQMVEDAYIHGNTYFTRDVLAFHLDELDVRAYRYDGYVAHIHDMKSYFEENMKLLKEENLNALFSGNQIYTKIRDDNPTRYINGATARNIMAADGCVIEGDVENSILFRGVRIGKGARVKNCVLMQDSVVEAGASVVYVVTDKKVVITEGKSLTGNDSFQVYVAKNQRV